MCRHCSVDPSFRGFDLRVSPLGAPVVFAARCRLPFRRLPLGGLPFGLTTSAFRHAPLRSCPRRVDLRAHRFRFSARTASGLPSASWPSGSRLPLFGTHRFGVAAGRVGLRAHGFRFSTRTASEIALGGLAFGLTTSAFRHAPLRGCRSASWFFRLPLRRLPLGGLGFGLTLRSCPRRVGLRAHDFRFRHAPLRGCRWAG